MTGTAHRLKIGTLAAVCIATTLFVSGCIGTSTNTRYYAFNAPELIDGNEGGLVISVGPFVIPDYLNRPQIVVRDQGTRLRILQFDRWAEPLMDSIAQRISLELSNELTSGVVYPFPSGIHVSPDYRVRGNIYNFEANTDGKVVLQLRWGVLNRDDDFVIAPRGENFSTRIKSSDDVAAITNAMNGLIGELAQSIAAELEQIGVE